MPPQLLLRFNPFAGDPVLDPAPTAGSAAVPVVVPLVGVQLRGPVPRPATPPRPEWRNRIEQRCEAP